MKNTLETIIIAEDLTGNKKDPKSCPGAKSFKRAHKKSLGFLERILLKINPKPLYVNWITYAGWVEKEYWNSYDEEGKLKDMMNSKIGDKVIFKKDETWEIL